MIYILTAVCVILEIVQVTAQCDFSPFDCLHSLDLAAHRRYCSRQLNVLLSSHAVLKGNIALAVLLFIALALLLFIMADAQPTFTNGV